jgi:hypothetical protein
MLHCVVQSTTLQLFSDACTVLEALLTPVFLHAFFVSFLFSVFTNRTEFDIWNPEQWCAANFPEPEGGRTAAVPGVSWKAQGIRDNWWVNRRSCGSISSSVTCYDHALVPQLEEFAPRQFAAAAAAAPAAAHVRNIFFRQINPTSDHRITCEQNMQEKNSRRHAHHMTSHVL